MISQEFMLVSMLSFLFISLLSGYPVAFTISGVSLLFAFLGAALNIFDQAYNNHLNFSFTNQADFGRTPITEPGRNFSAFVQYQF